MFNLTNLVWQGVSNRTFKLSILATTIASVSLLGACSSTPHNNKATITTTSKQTPLLDADGLGDLEDLLYATDMRAVETDRLQILRFGDVWKRITVGYGMDLNRYDARIEAQRSWFTSRQPYIDRLSARASRYLHYTVKEAERRGLPTELALLPIIESSYDPAATSSAAAAGLWQFIPSTGKIYGLRQSDLYDGRRDVVESTRAAYEYLSSLYNQFGSWELALASYNAGPGRIQQAINRNKAAGLPTDYWSLKLPQETMYYVPRFIAVAQIIKNPNAYGVSLPPIANRPHFREVSIPSSIDLNELSRLTGVSRGELYALNPGHRGNYTDPLAPRRILIPNEVHTSIDAKIAKMPAVSGSGGIWTVETAPLPVLPSAPSVSSTPALTTSVTTRPSSALVTNQPSQLPSSTVLTTQQPSTKAPVTPIIPTTTQKTPVGSQALANFANNAVIPSAPRVPVSINPSVPVAQVKTVVEPPISDAERQALVALIEKEEKTDKAKAEVIVQQIVAPKSTSQETQEIAREIAEIAPKGTEIVDPLDGAIKLTALQTSQSIAEQKGEESKLGYAYPRAVAEAERNSEDAVRNQGKPVVQTPKEVVVVAPQGKRDVYTVQSGDTLATIATRFGVNWRDIASWNQIEASNPLFVGTRLYLYNVKPVEVKAPVAVKPTKHVVKAGESLTSVSQQYQISLQDLAAWNNLTTSSNVLIGQNLHLVEPKDFKAKLAEEQAKAKQVVAAPKIETESYSVKSGEYFKIIADRHGLSVSELVALTPGLTPSSNLLVGQKINVPKQQKESKTLDNKAAKSEPKVSETKKPSFDVMTYTVSAGDNLSLVAQKHKMTLTEIAELNQLKNNATIWVGQKLQVKQTTPERPQNYRVLSGDTLIGVADKFDLNVAQLANMNGLKSDAMLRAGQVLKLDGEQKLAMSNVSDSKKTANEKADEKVDATTKFKGDTESYTVKSGDNLTALAQRYNISISELAGLNKLPVKSNLRVGQKIKVPKLTVTYKVQRGDTLIGLSKKFGLTVEELAQMNSIKVDTQVRLGQTLTVPN